MPNNPNHAPYLKMSAKHIDREVKLRSGTIAQIVATGNPQKIFPIIIELPSGRLYTVTASGRRYTHRETKMDVIQLLP